MSLAPLRVLLVEDDADRSRQLQAMLGQADPPFESRVVESLARARSLLEAEAFDAIVLDLNLPDSTGFDTLRSIRAAAEETPVLVLTGAVDEDVAVRAMKDGAQDYLAQSELSPQLLARSIRYGIERKRAERTLIHTQEALRRAQKLEAVGRLAGGIAHDFNNLLTAIVGHTSVLLDTVGPASALRSDLEEVERAATRATSLTRQLLAFSRKEVAVPRVFDVNRRLPELEKLFRRVIGTHVRIVTRLEGEALHVRMDPSQFEQVLLNLVVNARDAMSEGGTLTLSTGLDTEDRPAVVITVRDTGVGMTPDVMERMFEPFFTTKAAGKGTGLGLATVYGIIHENGGSIDVQSGPAQGTTIQIRLPAVEAAPEPQARPIPSAAPPEPVTGARVLVVDDDDAVRRLVARVLRGRGYEVLEAADAAEALAVAQSAPAPPMLLITDMTMPGANGHELSRILAGHFPALRIIIMSGHTEDRMVRQGVRDDEIVFLQKPFTPAQLLSIAATVLDDTEIGGP